MKARKSKYGMSKRQGRYLSSTSFKQKFGCLEDRRKASDEKRYKRDNKQDESETGQLCCKCEIIEVQPVRAKEMWQRDKSVFWGYDVIESNNIKKQGQVRPHCGKRHRRNG